MKDLGQMPSLYGKLVYIFVNALFFWSGEDYFAKSDYVKIAPKITPMLKNYQGMNILLIIIQLICVYLIICFLCINVNISPLKIFLYIIIRAQIYMH